MNWLSRLLPFRNKNNQAAPKRCSRPQSYRPMVEALEDRLQLSVSSIASNFNGTAVPAGDTVWFNSVMKVSGLGSAPVTLNVVNAEIDFTANGTAYHVPVPNASITLTPGATSAATTFDTGSNTWETATPSVVSGNVFVAGVALQVPSGLPGGINPVTWSADFQASTSGVSVNWQWAAAVYKNFSTDYTTLGVKPVDDNKLSAYQNSDHAGTPEAFRNAVLGGARGGGGANYTGSYSGTGHVTAVVVTATGSLSGYVQQDNGTNPDTGLPNPPSGIQYVTLTLTGQTSSGQTVNISVMTDSNGYYTFGELQAGNYTITQTVPDSYTAESNDSFSGITVNGDNLTNYNFLDQMVVL